MPIKIVTFMTTLFQLAKKVGDAKKAGDVKEIEKAEFEFEEYKKIMMESDEIQ